MIGPRSETLRRLARSSFSTGESSGLWEVKGTIITVIDVSLL